MKKNILITVVVIAVLLVAGLVFVFGRSGSKESQKSADQNVSLQASADKEIYKSGETVNLKMSLTNSGATSVCLSEGAIGNIKFLTTTVNGSPVETRTAPSAFLTSFSEILKSRLTSVAPGASMEFKLASEYDPGLGAQALSTTMPDGTAGIATFYNVEKPGQYEIQLAYEYVAGSSEKCKDILTGKTNVTTVLFKVE